MKRVFAYAATITTNGTGDATVYFGKKIHGRVVAVKYAPGGASGLATGADLTLTGETTEVPILIKANAGQSTVWYRPRTIPNLNTNGSSFSDIDADIFVGSAEAPERIKLVVAQGGDTLAGAMTVFVEEDTMSRLFAFTETILIPAAVTTVTVYFGRKIHGRVHAIKFTIGTLEAGCTITLTGETTGVPILAKQTPAAWYHPRALANKNTDGSALTDVPTDIFVGSAEAPERIKLVVTDAVAAETGTMTIYVEQDE